MKIKTSSMMDFSPQELAQALAASTPDEFAAFWMEFHVATEKKDLLPFAVAMAPDLGANRKKPLHELVRLITFVETHDNRIRAGREPWPGKDEENDSDQ